MGANRSMLVNLTFQALSNNTNLTTTFNVTGINNIGNTSQANTTVNITINAVLLTAAQLGAFAPTLADNFTNFTTNLSLVPDISNVSGLRVANRNGSVNWSLSTVNANGNVAPIGTQILFGRGTTFDPNGGFLVLNTSAFHSSFNRSALVTFYNVSCPSVPRPVYNPNTSFAQNAIDIASRGQDCISAGACINVTCSAGADGRGNMTFIALHFSSFVSSGNANLTIDSQGGRQTQLVLFNATYINATSGALITGATCNMSMSDEPSTSFNMTEGAVTYTHSKIVNAAGTHTLNITCTKAGYTTLNALLNVTISALPGSTGGGGEAAAEAAAVTGIHRPTTRRAQL